MAGTSTDFEKLAAEAEELDREAGAAPEGEPEPEEKPKEGEYQQSERERLKEAQRYLEYINGALVTFYPIASQPPEVIDEGAKRLAPLMEREWFLKIMGGEDNFIDRWGPEIDAAVFFGGIGFVTYLRIQEHKKKQKHRDTEPSPVASEAPPEKQASEGTIFDDPAVQR